MSGTRKESCGRCFGMGVLELPNGDTTECRNCGGKGHFEIKIPPKELEERDK